MRNLTIDNGVKVRTKNNMERAMLYKAEVEVKTKHLNSMSKKERCSEYANTLRTEIAKAKERMEYYQKLYESELQVIDYNTLVALATSIRVYFCICDLEEINKGLARCFSKARKQLTMAEVIIQSFVGEGVKGRKAEDKRVKADKFLDTLGDRLEDHWVVLESYINSQMDVRYNGTVKASEELMIKRNTRASLKMNDYPIPDTLDADIVMLENVVKKQQDITSRMLCSMAYITEALGYIIMSYYRNIRDYGYVADRENPTLQQCEAGCNAMCKVLDGLNKDLRIIAAEVFNKDKGAYQHWLNDIMCIKLVQNGEFWCIEDCEDNNEFINYITKNEKD